MTRVFTLLVTVIATAFAALATDESPRQSVDARNSMRRKQIYVDKKSFSVSAAHINLMSIALKKNSPNLNHRRISQNIVTAPRIPGNAPDSISSGKGFRLER